MYYAARVRYHLNGTTHLILQVVREVCAPPLRCGSAPVGDISLDIVLHKVASEQSTVAGVLEEVMQEQLQAIAAY
jgi:hypothetical protein